MLTEYLPWIRSPNSLMIDRSLGVSTADRDHVPSQSLLHKLYAANLPVVQVCKECNKGHSLDEQYVTTFLGCVLAGSTDPDQQRFPRSHAFFERACDFEKGSNTRRRSFEIKTETNDEPRRRNGSTGQRQERARTRIC